MRSKPLALACAATALAAGGLLVATTTSSGAQRAAAAVIDVHTAAELKAALAGAGPGDTIRLADGTYTGNFKTTADGTSGSPITLTGSADAVLKAGGGYGLHLDGASNWQIEGITV